MSQATGHGTDPRLNESRVPVLEELTLSGETDMEVRKDNEKG